MEIYLNKIKEAAERGDLYVILGSKLFNDNPWQEFLGHFWQFLTQEIPELSAEIEELQERDLPCEVLGRILYKNISEDFFNLLRAFSYEKETSIQHKVALLLQHKRVRSLGVVSVDNRLHMAIQRQNISTEPDAEQIPLVSWMNGHVEKKDIIKAILECPQQSNLSNKITLDFFRRIKKTTACVVVMGLFPGDFGWRTVLGQLSDLAKKNVPIYWCSNQELIPIAHIVNISGGGFVKKTIPEILDTLAEGIQNIPQFAEEQTPTRDYNYILDIIRKNNNNNRWQYVIAVLLNQVCNRSASLRIFQNLQKSYAQENNQSMLASCYRNMGRIFFEQGYMEKAIEQHLKASDIWLNIQDLLSTAEEYVLCGDNYWNGSSPEKANQYFTEALRLYRHQKNDAGIAESATKLAQLSDAQEEYENAKSFYLESIQARQNMQDIYGEIANLLSLGNCLVKTQAYDDAQQTLQATIEMAQNYEDYVSLGEAYQIMGLVHTVAQDYLKAREYYEKVYTLYQTEHDELSLTFVYCHLGHVCARLEDYDNAIKYYENSMEYYEKIGDWQHLAAVYTNLGLIYSNRKEYRLSEEYFARCEEIFAALGDIFSLIRTHTNLAKVYTMQNQMDNAIECYRANIEMLTQLGEKEELASNLVAISMTYLQNKKLDEASANLQKALGIYNSLGLEEEKKETLQILQVIENRRTMQ